MAQQFITAFIGTGILFALLAGVWRLGGRGVPHCGGPGGACMGCAPGRCPHTPDGNDDGRPGQG